MDFISVLEKYGFTEEYRAEYIGDELACARVIRQLRDGYTIVTDSGEMQAKVKGALMKQYGSKAEYPTVGDFVTVKIQPGGKDAVIHHVFSRKSIFYRTLTLVNDEQAVAANFDYVFIISSLNADLNIRRLERYLTVALQSGGTPVVVLTKLDECADRSIIDEISNSLGGVDVIAVSAVTGENIDAVQRYLSPGKTLVFLGMSGVGKSTLLNRLYGDEIMKTGGIRENDSRGRHTTAHRELVLLKNGSMIIDTPGMRSLSVPFADEGLMSAFADIDELAAGCRFTDCKHRNEPGCEVAAAIAAGSLSADRFSSYEKLKEEMRLEERKERRALKQLENEKLSRIRKDKFIKPGGR